MSESLTARQLAESLIEDHARDIEWLSIGEAIDYHMENGDLPNLTEEEFEKFQHEVDREIADACVIVVF